MRKTITILLAALLIISFASCSAIKNEGNNATDIETSSAEINRFISLENDKTLYVGENKSYTNYEIQTVSPVYSTRLISATYTLKRTSYASSYDIPCVEYNGYYFYWITESTNEEILLGNKNVKTTYQYEYMTYGERNNIVIRLTRTTETSYDFDGGFITQDFDYTVELGNYFQSWEILAEECPDLAKQINTTGSKKYYIDVTTPTTVTYDTYTATDTYYYFENNVTAE